MNLFNILKRCKEAITSTSKKGKIIIIDAVINEEDEHDNTRAKLVGKKKFLIPLMSMSELKLMTTKQ